MRLPNGARGAAILEGVSGIRSGAKEKGRGMQKKVACLIIFIAGPVADVWRDGKPM